MSGAGPTLERWAQLRQRMEHLGLQDADLDEQFIRGAGPGGQKTNKTSSVVVLRHGPSGLQVRCGGERSQSLNRFRAREALCDTLEARARGEADTRRQEQERIRRQKRRRSRKQKARMLDAKRRHGDKKAARSWRSSPE